MSLPFEITEKLKKRFWEKVDIKNNNDKCWLWMGDVLRHNKENRKDNYGRIEINYKRRAAHRVAWILTNGEIPSSKGFEKEHNGTPTLHVLHKCDVKSCCNPNHLFIGTNNDNMKDRNKKGRQARREKHPFYKKPHKNGNAKLTMEDVKEIREKYAKGDIIQKELGRQYGINRSHISHIINGKSWKVIL